MRSFELRRYFDGGPNDRGAVLAYCKASNKKEAEQVFREQMKVRLPDPIYEVREISNIPKPIPIFKK